MLVLSWCFPFFCWWAWGRDINRCRKIVPLLGEGYLLSRSQNWKVSQRYFLWCNWNRTSHQNLWTYDARKWIFSICHSSNIRSNPFCPQIRWFLACWLLPLWSHILEKVRSTICRSVFWALFWWLISGIRSGFFPLLSIFNWDCWNRQRLLRCRHVIWTVLELVYIEEFPLVDISLKNFYFFWQFIPARPSSEDIYAMTILKAMRVEPFYFHRG